MISYILESSKNIALNTDQLVLQPMTAADSLRRWLEGNGFEIRDEKIVKEDRHFYFIIKAKKGMMKYEDPLYYEISKILTDKKDP